MSVPLGFLVGAVASFIAALLGFEEDIQVGVALVGMGLTMLSKIF